MFQENILNSLIFHIPHSSTHIPLTDGYDWSLVHKELQLLTDHDTDKIFNVPNTSKIITPFSRIFCDVERLSDDIEPMFQFGRGFFYTKTDSGLTLRSTDKEFKNHIYQNYYKPHHKLFNDMVNHKLKEEGFCTIIDCHSFSDKPFLSDLKQDNSRPDICIGFDKFHTPNWLLDRLVCIFTLKGYSVKINDPYEGTIVPLEHFNINKNVNSVMIEINRKLYMNDNQPIPNEVEKLNKIIQEIFVL
jgi:N-formylglutamate amidohydrolase